MLRDTPPPSLEYRIPPPSAGTPTTTTVPAPPGTTPPPSPPRALHLDDVFGDVSPPASPAAHTRSGRQEAEDDELEVRGLVEGNEASEVPAVRRIHTTAGYRDGVAVSKERYVQEGFDEGYALGGEIGIRIGWVLGGLEGCVAALMKKGEEGQLEGARELLLKAREELKIEKVLGREWVGEDGIWKWSVGEEQEGITFREVAAAHPVIVKWTGVMEERSKAWGLNLGYPAHDGIDG